MLSTELFIIYVRDFKEVSGVSGNELGTVFSSNQKEEYNNNIYNLLYSYYGPGPMLQAFKQIM